ncbi:MAG: IgA Peptidase M64, partial [Candidatus Aminicenantes bacterium]|nr:IgA Peptidase M64 [Candidatus Aminicenantes bacterium]
MKNTTLLVVLFLLISACGSAGIDNDFDTFFTDKTMRIDYYHIGDAESEIVTVDLVSVYGIWAGSRTRLVDPFDNGRYCVKIYDATSDTLLYSRGFDSYFGEYQTSSPAAEGVKRTFHETALVPAPKKPVRFALDRRGRDNRFQEIFTQTIDPAATGIIHDKVIDPDIQIIEAHMGGDPHKCVDIAIVGEGYTLEEADKFKKDIRRHVDIFFGYEPYKSMKDAFNIRGVLKPSEESGVDEPRAGIFKNTSLNAAFNALGSERYLLTEDNRTLRDIAAYVPYDAVMIMVNHKRYGGGGIYNFYCTFTADTQFHEYNFIHEFGHSFTGLADEYYTSAVAYNDFYPRGVEPVEANITALLDPDNLKWKDLMDEGTPIPTPWEKDAFDTMDTAWQKERAVMNDQIAGLKKTGASPEKIRAAEEEYARRDKEHSDKVDAYLEASRWRGKVGAYEGAGYSADGLYRPMVDCIMFSQGAKPF